MQLLPAANGSTSSTNFSILIPFGWSGFTGCPCSSHRGLLHSHIGCSRGLRAPGNTRPAGGKTHFRWTPRGPSLPPAGRVGPTGQTGHNGHRAVRAQLSPVSARARGASHHQPSPLTRTVAMASPGVGWRPWHNLSTGGPFPAAWPGLSDALQLVLNKSHSATHRRSGLPQVPCSQAGREAACYAHLVTVRRKSRVKE